MIQQQAFCKCRSTVCQCTDLCDIQYICCFWFIIINIILDLSIKSCQIKIKKTFLEFFYSAFPATCFFIFFILQQNKDHKPHPTFSSVSSWMFKRIMFIFNPSQGSLCLQIKTKLRFTYYRKSSSPALCICRGLIGAVSINNARIPRCIMAPDRSVQLKK